MVHSALPPLSLAFVALTSRLSTELLSDQARHLCASKARREILTRAAEDEVPLGLVQALCLLVQDSIAGRHRYSRVIMLYSQESRKQAAGRLQ